MLDSDRKLNDFILRIEPADYTRMETGVEYELAWEGKDAGLRWHVPPGLKLARPKR